MPVGFIRGRDLLDRLARRGRIFSPWSDYLGDSSVGVPLVYGRRWVEGIVIEATTVELTGGQLQQAIFYALAEGEIDDIKRVRVDGVERSDVVSASLKVSGIYYRVGAVGVDDVETEAEYSTDATTQQRSQNEDYRTDSGTTYSETAYLILIRNVDTDDTEALRARSVPRVEAELGGLKVQAYTAAGAADGAKAVSESPVWNLLDFVMSAKHGLNIDSADVDFAVCKATADYCDTAISGTIAATLVTTTQASASTQCIVTSTEGFRRGAACEVDAVANTVEDIVSDTELTLGTAVTQDANDIVTQKPPRFGANIAHVRRVEASDLISDVLTSCFGYVTYDNGKIQIRAEQATVAERLTNGSLDAWSGGSVTSWTNVSTGGTHNEETTDVNTAGGSADKMSKTSGGNLFLSQTLTDDTLPGAWYRMTWYAKASTARTDGVRARVRNATTGDYCELDGVTWSQPFSLAKHELKIGDSTTSWAQYQFDFRLKTSFAATDSIIVTVGANGASVGDDFFVDDVVLRGPFAGVFTDTSTRAGNGIIDGSFAWSLSDPLRRANRVVIRLDADDDDTGTSEVVANDWDKQVAGKVREFELTSGAINDTEQAERIAEMLLAKASTLGPGATMQVGPEGMLVQPGDIVLVTHAVPNWSSKEVRVTRKRVAGLGNDSEFLTTLEVEDYVEAIYLDETPWGPRQTPTRASRSLTLAIDRATAAHVAMTATLSGGSASVLLFEFFASLTSGFSAEQATLIGSSFRPVFVWQPTDSFIGSTVYFRAQVITDRGPILSAEVSADVVRVTETDLDPASGQFLQPDNLVYDGDFASGSNWTLTKVAGTSNYFPTAGSSTGGGYNNTANAEDADTTDNSSVTDPPSGGSITQQWDFTSSDIRSGTLRVTHDVQNGVDATCRVRRSINNGSSWSGYTNSNTTQTDTDYTLTDQLLSDVVVEAENNGTAGLGDQHRIYRIYVFADNGEATISGGVLRLRGNGASNASKAERDFPVQITTARKHFAPGSQVVCCIDAARISASAAPDAAVEVYIRDNAASWEQVLLSIPAASIDSASYQTFAGEPVTIDAGIPSAALKVGVRTESTTAVLLDKVAIRRGAVHSAWAPHPSENEGTGGTIGDFGSGGTGGGGGGSGSGYGGGGGTGTPLIPPP